MSDVPIRLRRLVVRRAENRCEYCGLSQKGQEATFHIDHILPVVANGPTTAANPALACVSCSLRKSARQTAVDPRSGDEVALFHPRRDTWSAHFRWDGVRIVGLTPTGRATVTSLDMNRPLSWQYAPKKSFSIVTRRPDPVFHFNLPQWHREGMTGALRPAGARFGARSVYKEDFTTNTQGDDFYG